MKIEHFQSITKFFLPFLIVCYFANLPQAHASCYFNLSSYALSEICGSIHIYEKPNNLFDYSNCRILNGSLTLRNLDIAQLKPFINLEVIMDFVLIKNISSSTDQTLSDILPRLNFINGRYQILYYTLYVIDYAILDNLQLPSLKRVCGNFILERSSGLCFPHSKTYWNIISNQERIFPYQDIPRIDNYQITKQLNDSHFFGSIILPIIDESHKSSVLQNRLKTLRLVAYQIDSKMFEFYKNLPKNWNSREKYIDNILKYSKCYNIAWQRIFAIGNLWNIENIPFIENSDQINHVLSKKIFPQYPNYMMNLSQKYSGDNSFLENYYDLLRIFAINLNFEGFKNYKIQETFQYESYYIFKVMLCTEFSIIACKIDRVFLFHHSLDSPYKYYIILTALILFAFLFIIFAFYFYLKVQESKKNFRKDIISFNPEYTPLGSFQSDSDMRSRKCCEIDNNRLVLNAENLLGKGQFGYVYEGVLNDFTVGSHCIIPGNEEHYEHEFQDICSSNFEKIQLRVAIKQLKSNVNDSERERFLLEANIMRNFDSPFLVKLIGVCSISEPVMVVMEFMQSGDLKRYLTKCQHDFKKTRSIENIPKREQMIEWAIQIADGMCYLHSKQVIHRDLATRNCMLTKDLQIKIGDFGLTRHVFGSDYYRLSTQMSMPLRWMAPESLQKMIFTTKTDVWSYGVVLWEIMSLGKQPYKGVPDELVKELISGHSKLPSPQFQYPFLWDLTKFCWSRSASHRPTFETIVKIVLSRLSSEAKSRFTVLSFFHQNCSVEEKNQELVDSRTNSLFSRAWDMFYQNFFSRPESSTINFNKDIDKSFYSRYRRYRTAKHYPTLFVRSNSNSSESSGSSRNSVTSDNTSSSPVEMENVRKISYDSVYSSATQDYSSDSK